MQAATKAVAGESVSPLLPLMTLPVGNAWGRFSMSENPAPSIRNGAFYHASISWMASGIFITRDAMIPHKACNRFGELAWLSVMICDTGQSTQMSRSCAEMALHSGLATKVSRVADGSLG